MAFQKILKRAKGVLQIILKRVEPFPGEAAVPG
jgi:hypothetical protein